MTSLCPDCFGDAALKNRLEDIRPKYDTKIKCNFHPSKKGVPVFDVAKIVDDVFMQHYYVADEYHSTEFSDTLDNIVREITQVEQRPSNSLIQALIDTENPVDREEGVKFYDRNLRYMKHYTDMVAFENKRPHSWLWESFCRSILYSQRFFNDEAINYLREILNGIQYQKDQNLNPPVRRINVNDNRSSFWRARIVNDSEEREEVKKHLGLNLGAPPERLRSPGRMNSSGIRAFYGAYDISTCVSELRPTVGSKVVAAKFKLEREVHVLDLTRFIKPVKDHSLFSKVYHERIQQWNFMRQFMEEVARPISPADSHLDYIPTQVLAEYLVHQHPFKRSGKDVNIEGIIFASAQSLQGKNIVLFGDAARCVLTDEEESHLNNGKVKKGGEILGLYGKPKTEKVKRTPGLSVISESFIVEEIESAEFRSNTIDGA